MTESYGKRVDDLGGWMGSLKDSRRSQDGGSNGTTWGRYHRERRNANRGVERGFYEELKEMYGEENIISAVIHVDETTTPHLHCDFCAVDRGESIMKDVIGDKRNAQDAS